MKIMIQVALIAIFSLNAERVSADDRKISRFEALVNEEFATEIKESGLKRILILVVELGSYRWEQKLQGYSYAGRREGYIEIGEERFLHLEHPSNTLRLCHELGHLLTNFYSSEGHADYFATSKCLPRLLRHVSFPSEIDPREDAKEKCHLAHVDPEKRSTCEKIAWISKEVSLELLGDHQFEPGTDLLFPDYANPLAKTWVCRYRTFLAGALCDLDPHDRMIKKRKGDPKGICAASTLGAMPACLQNH